MNTTFYKYQKDYKNAQRVVGDGLRRFPNNERLLLVQGALFKEEGNKKTAIETMKKILKSNPNSVEALNFIAYEQAEQGKNLAQAEQLVLKARSIGTRNVSLQAAIEDSLGWIQLKQGKTDLALLSLEKAAKLDGKNPTILDHLGEAYKIKKNFPKAIESFEKAAGLYAKDDQQKAKLLKDKIASLRPPRSNASLPIKANPAAPK